VVLLITHPLDIILGAAADDQEPPPQNQQFKTPDIAYRFQHLGLAPVAVYVVTADVDIEPSK
jgi:hypothetical protein